MEVRRGGHRHRGSCIAHHRQHVVEGQNAGRLGSGARSIISAVTPEPLDDAEAAWERDDYSTAFQLAGPGIRENGRCYARLCDEQTEEE
jgi:hypothetical protein